MTPNTCHPTHPDARNSAVSYTGVLPRLTHFTARRTIAFGDFVVSLKPVTTFA